MGRLGGEASAEIEAPIDDVWRAIEDVSAISEWQKGVIQSTPRERDGEGRTEVMEVVNDAKIRKIKSVVRFTYGGPTSLTWIQESGDAKSVDGSWHLEDLGGGRTRATYKLAVDPGMVLGMLARGPAVEQVRAILVSGRPDELAERVRAERS